MQKLLKWPHLQDEVIEYVQKTGVLVGVEESLSMELSHDSIERALDPENKQGLLIPEFLERYTQALKDFVIIHKHPMYDPDIQRNAYQMFADDIQYGEKNQGEIEYDDHNRPKKKVYHRSGLKKWQWDVLHPPATYSESAVVLITANYYAMTLEDDELSQEEKDKFIQQLAKLKRKSLEELQKQGFQPKH